MRRILLISICLLVLLACTSQPKIEPFEKTKFMMGTIITITVYDVNKPRDYVEQAIDAAFEAIARVNHLASVYNDSSEISLVNREAGNRYVEVDSNLFKIIQQSQRFAELSDGAFDITVSPLIKLWDYHNPNPRLPSQEDIQQALSFVNYKDILLENNRIKFKRPGMKIDLGGIAKGEAVDRAMSVLKKRGITDAMVNIGGNLSAMSSKLTEGKRKVWVRHPRQEGRYYGYFTMDNGSVATSGDYERFFILDSVRYHHIIDPKTGYPATGCVSTTIRAQNAMLADVLSTTVFVLGIEKGMQLINQLEGVEGVIIFEENKRLTDIVSTGLVGKFFVEDK